MHWHEASTSRDAAVYLTLTAQVHIQAGGGLGTTKVVPCTGDVAAGGLADVCGAEGGAVKGFKDSLESLMYGWIGPKREGGSGM